MGGSGRRPGIKLFSQAPGSVRINHTKNRKDASFMFAIYKKELRSYFITPVGYVYVGIFLALSALICCFTTLHNMSYETASYFTYIMFGLVVMIPLLTMRLFSEEKKQRTEQMLLTAPVSLTGMVLGKFFAAFTLFVGTLLVSCLNFFPLYSIAIEERAAANLEYQGAGDSIIGPVTGQIVGRLIGIILIGAAFIAIGTFISSFTESQLAAAVTTIAVILGMVIIGFLNSTIDVYAVRFVLDWISVLSRYSNFSYGLFDFSALVYYLSICSVFLFLTVRVYEKRRWN